MRASQARNLGSSFTAPGHWPGLLAPPAAGGCRMTTIIDASREVLIHSIRTSTVEYSEWSDERWSQLPDPALRGLAETVFGQREVDEAAAAQAKHEQELHDWDVRNRLTHLRVDRDARRQLDDETRPPGEPPPVRSLDDLLAEPDEETPYRIEGLALTESRILLSAPYKAGKSTVVGNLVRSLADAEPFLGHFAVNDPAQSIVIVDTELSKKTLRRWLREQNIVNTAAVRDVIALRGKVGTFNLADDRCRAQWARRFQDLGTDYLILDCLKPVLDAMGLDENNQVGEFLIPFEAMLADAGIADALVIQHMGHSGERARGSSQLLAWPDALWNLVRENPDDPASPRFFSAYGRDVDVAEGLLEYDPQTRHLRLLGQSRKVAAAEANARADLQHLVGLLVEDVLGDGDGINQRSLLDAAASKYDIGRPRVIKAIALGESEGLISHREGARRSKIYTLANPCSECARPVTAPDQTIHHECEPKT